MNRAFWLGIQDTITKEWLSKDSSWTYRVGDAAKFTSIKAADVSAKKVVDRVVSVVLLVEAGCVESLDTILKKIGDIS